VAETSTATFPTGVNVEEFIDMDGWGASEPPASPTPNKSPQGGPDGFNSGDPWGDQEPPAVQEVEDTDTDGGSDNPSPPPPPPVKPVRPQGGDATGVRDIAEYMISVREYVDNAVHGIKRDVGIDILQDRRSKYEPNSIREVIYKVRWHFTEVVDLHPQDLHSMGVALSAHQVYVQAIENEWSARSHVLNDELKRVMLDRRARYDGATVAEQENALIKHEVEIRKLYSLAAKAKAMARALDLMGDRFQQMENSLKRPSDRQSRELDRRHHDGE